MKYARQFFLIAMICVFAMVPVLDFVGAQAGNQDGRGGTNSGPPPFKLENPLRGDITSLTDFLIAILNNIVLPVGAVVVVFLIIYTGFQFVTARGDVKQIGAAKESLKNIVIGTVILFGAVAITYAIRGTVCQIAPTISACVGNRPLP